MAKQTTNKPGWGSIHADESLPLREASRRLGWGYRTARKAQRNGLKVVQIGSLKYTRGDWIAEYLDRLAAESEVSQ
ncbi:MAG: hypothetical protein JXM70_20950 [Pirellulales bacterium]|nr:hypothetical protein [Pirellulales bacterium]